jgi:hypothetical protein
MARHPKDIHLAPLSTLAALGWRQRQALAFIFEAVSNSQISSIMIRKYANHRMGNNVPFFVGADPALSRF